MLPLIGLNLTGRPNDATPPPPPTETLTLTDIPRDRLIYDSAAALSGSHATVALSGTGTPGETVELRAVSLDDAGASSTQWTAVATIAGDSTWSGTLSVAPSTSWFRAEARLAASPAISAATANRFGIGHVFALWGQSEINRLIGAAHDHLTPTTIADDEAVQIVFHDRATPGAGGVLHHFVSDADPLTAAVAAMAASLIAAAPGAKFALAFQTKSGTNFDDLLNDANATRSFANDQAVHDHITANGTTAVGVALSSWFAGPRTYAGDYGAAFQAMSTGTALADGSALTLPTTLTAGGTDITLDHSLAELYDPSQTVIAVGGPHRFSITGTDPATSELQLIETCRLAQRAMVAANTSPFTMVLAGEAMDYLNGEPQTNGSYDLNGTNWGDFSHPNRHTEDGQNRLARILAHHLMQVAGIEAWTVPTLDNVAWTTDKITLTSSAGPITTAEHAGGGAALVAGFALNGAPVTNATVTSGAIEIPGSFDFADNLTFGRHGGTGMTDFPGDYFNALWRRYPLADVGLADLEGIALRPLPDLANTLSAPASFVADGTFRFQEPGAIGAGISALTWYADLTVTSSASQADLFRLSGNNNLVLELEGNNSITVVVKDEAGTTLLNQNTGNGTYDDNQPYEIWMSADLAGQQFRLWLNGTPIIDAPLPANSGAFASNRTLLFLGSNRPVLGVVRALRVWTVPITAPTAPTAAPHHAVTTANPPADPWYLLN